MKLPGMILDLLEENGISDLPASIEIIARASDRWTPHSSLSTWLTTIASDPAVAGK